MMKVKLSPAQIRILKALAEPSARLEWVDGVGWCFVTLVNIRTMNFLRNHGLIDIQQHKDVITPAGRACLADLEASQ